MRFLFAWELGGGLGHMVQLAQIARPLLASGHHIDFALRDLSGARTALAELHDHPHVRLWQAPVWQPAFRAARHPISYPELLFAAGYLDAKRLIALVHAWRSLFASIAPDLLLVDHSPTALLAARGFAFPRVSTGTGFVVPPAAEPIPAFAEWEPAEPARVATIERFVLETCNTMLDALGQPPLGAFHELYSENECFLFTSPELDHYGPSARRPGTTYRGALAAPPGGSPPCWPDGDGPRLFAYLKIEYQQTAAILRQLMSGPWRTFAYVSGMQPPDAAKSQSPYLNVSTSVADLEAVGRSADALLCHGGFNTVSQLLAAGVPAIVLPMQPEQMLVGGRLLRSRAGLVVFAERVAQDLPIALDRIATETSFRDAARSFAERHSAGGKDVARLAAARCEALAGAHAADPRGYA
jgi:hypothetical protein